MSYTEQITKEILAEYKADPVPDTVVAISARIGKSTRSVIAKLSSEGVYVVPVRLTKTGDTVRKKEQMVADIERWLKMSVPTLAKSGKQDLALLHGELYTIFGDYEDA